MTFQTTGYHTVSYKGEENFLQEIKINAPFKCTRSDAWLSHGYYFWEDDVERAKDWGRKSYGNKYVILRCDLVLEKMLDLVGTRRHQKEFVELEALVRSKLGLEKEVPISKVIAYLRRLSEKEKSIFDYDSVKAEDHPKRKEYSFIDANKRTKMDLNPRIQICIFEKTNSNIVRKEVIEICKG